MAVHLMLSPEAIMEAKLLMLAPNNIISPSNGEPIASSISRHGYGMFLYD